MYKLLVLDIDGTLLNKHQQISALTKNAIQQINKNNVKVIIATGRTKQSIDPYIKELGLESNDNYSILHNGALITTNTNKTLWQNTIDYDDFMTIYHLKEKHHLDISAYTDKSILIEKNSYYSNFDATASSLPLVKVNFKNLNPATSLLKIVLINEDLTMADDFNKIFPNINVDMPQLKAKTAYNKRLFYSLDIFPNDLIKRFNISKITPYNIELSNKSANKKAGVEFLAHMLKVKKEEIICIGDSNNDHQMIEYAGLGVAMGNALPQIKKIANIVTKDNNNDGVAHVISTYLLNKAT